MVILIYLAFSFHVFKQLKNLKKIILNCPETNLYKQKFNYLLLLANR